MSESINFTSNNIPKLTNTSLIFGPGYTSGYSNSYDFVTNPKNITIPGTQFNPFTRLGINHWVNSAPLSDIPNFGTDPNTLLIKGTSNIYCIDASIFPEQPPCHPIADIFMMAEKASDVFLNSNNMTMITEKTHDYRYLNSNKSYKYIKWITIIK